MSDLLEIIENPSKNLSSNKHSLFVNTKAIDNSVVRIVNTNCESSSDYVLHHETFTPNLESHIIRFSMGSLKASTTKRALLESVSYPSRRTFFYNSYEKLKSLYNDLEMKNENVLKVGRLLIEECVKQNKTNVIISRTGDDELLLYRYRNNCYYNIIIDEDADIEFLIISSIKGKTKTESYYFKKGLDYKALVEKI